MHWTGEITLGNLAIVATLIGMAIGIGIRLGAITQLLADHSQRLMDHSTRLDRYEARLVTIVGDVQRLIGRIELTQDRLDARIGPRNP